MLDTVESLFAGLTDTGVLRAELRRLFAWLKKRGVTAVITGERGHGALTRHGLEEYVSDCVILLDHRVDGQISTRRLRIVKYRGSSHGTNEYPFLIDREGISVLPITSLQLQHGAPLDRLSTGLPWLDQMLGGRGYYRGSTVLLSGAAGTAKTTLAAYFLDAACRRGERALCFLFEESPAQYVRNMRSIGLDLEPWVKQGRLRVSAARPSLYGLEFHLATMYREIDRDKPAVVVVDPLSSFVGTSSTEVNEMLIRLIDYLKMHNLTGVFTHLIPGTNVASDTELGVSSLVDAWILLRNVPGGPESGRRVTVLKARGMAHAADDRRFRLTDHGAVADGSMPSRGRAAGGRA